jgi:predicted patatin/cPLA2 family phospholipase
MPLDLVSLKGLRAAVSQPAIQHILDRRIAVLEGRPVDHTRKLAIVVEGGAMRAVISGGSFIALDFLGLTDVFDLIYGSSAGAINAAYFLAHQIAYGVAVYYQLINNRQFVNLARLLDPRPSAKVVNMDFLFDEVIAKARPLDVERVRSSPTELYASVTDKADGAGSLFSSKDLALDLRTLLKASSAIPVYYNQPVSLVGRQYIDGSVANALPIEAAIAAGCTDVLALLTRPSGYRKKPPNMLSRLYSRLKLRGYDPRFTAVYISRHNDYNRSLQLLVNQGAAPKPVDVSIVAPPIVVGRTTTTHAALRDATAASILYTLECFGCSRTEIVEILQPFLHQSSPA